MRNLKFDLKEVAGSLGDLATFLPLAVGLITVNGVNATSLFLSAGLLYIGAGLYYGIPIPVQPLKATSAVAIAMAVRPEAISVAAFWMGVLFVSVSLFNVNGLFRKIFTRPIVRGIQLGLGILLVKGGLSALFGSPSMSSLGGWGTSPVFGALVGAAVAGIIVLSQENRRFPATLAILAFGIVAGGASTSFAALSSVSLGWVRPEWGIPIVFDFYTVFIVLLLPQIPLTFANSMAATADTAARYYGKRALKVSPRALAATLGIGNLFAGLIGGMPMCHGSGGGYLPLPVRSTDRRGKRIHRGGVRPAGPSFREITAGTVPTAADPRSRGPIDLHRGSARPPGAGCPGFGA